MVFIIIELYKNAGVDVITVEKKYHFWVKMKDVEDGLGIKNLCDSLRREIQAIFETKKLTKERRNSM